MSQRLLLFSVLILFFVLPVWSQFPPVQVATSDMPEATAFNNGHKLAQEGWVNGPIRIHTVFTSANDVFHSFSANEGSTWSSPVNVSQTSGPSRYPAVAWDSLHSTLFAVWQDSTPGQNEIYCSSYQGNAWSTPVNVSNTPGQSIHPSLDSDYQGRLYLVYADNSSGNYEIYYQRYESGAWTDTLNLSQNAGLSDFPSVGVYGGDVYVCWEDNTPGNFDNFERHWNGSVWSALRNLSQTPANSRWPSLSCPTYVDFGFSVTWVEADTAIRVIGRNGGGASRAHPCLYPVISNVGTTGSFLGWQEQDTFWFQRYYFNHGGWDPPSPIDQGRYPSVFGDNFLFTRGLSSPYRVMYWAALYLSGSEGEEPARQAFPLRLYLRPNPSPGRVTVSLSLPQAVPLLLEVYDLHGALLRTLARTAASAGKREFVWDGRDDLGHKVPTGVYLLRALSGTQSQTAKLVLLR